MKMKIAVTGPNGNVGKALVRRGAIPLNCDIRNKDEVRKEVNAVLPDVIVNTASKTRPDWCEPKEHAEEVIKCNVRGPYYLAIIAEELKIPMIALSTDHIFDGRFGPYKESGGRMVPVNFYGASKLGMETLMSAFKNVKIVRTSNLFWREDKRVTWYINHEGKTKVPTFQKRSFMYIEHFVDALNFYIENIFRMPKILNISGSKTVDWYTFVMAFADAIGTPTDKFSKRRFEENKFLAKRPKRAGLVTTKSAELGLPQFDYLDGLEDMKLDLVSRNSNV